MPDLSVIMATYNRRARLERALDGLAAQAPSCDAFEVVVVDDGSTDGTAAWLADLKFPFEIQVLRQENAGPAAARNRGVEAARAGIVLFLDDDVIAGPTLVGEHLRSHAREDRVAVIGPLASLPRYRQPWVAWEQRNIDRQYRAMLRGDWSPTFRQFWTGNASVARSAVLEAGGFDPTLRRGEDVELASRMVAHGIEFRFNPAASGTHHAERSLPSWCEMHRAYGRLEISIYRRFGEARAREILVDNWRGLHPATKRLVSSCLDRPALAAAARGVLEASIRAGATLPFLSRPAQAACGALSNLLYWSGAAEAMGTQGVRAVFATTAAPDREKK